MTLALRQERVKINGTSVIQQQKYAFSMFRLQTEVREVSSAVFYEPIYFEVYLQPSLRAASTSLQCLRHFGIWFVSNISFLMIQYNAGVGNPLYQAGPRAKCYLPVGLKTGLNQVTEAWTCPRVIQ